MQGECVLSLSSDHTNIRQVSLSAATVGILGQGHTCDGCRRLAVVRLPGFLWIFPRLCVFKLCLSSSSLDVYYLYTLA